MLRIIKYKTDAEEIIRRVKRCCDWQWSYRKIFLAFLITVLLLYFGHPLFRLSSKPDSSKDYVMRCIDDRLTPFYAKALEHNANIRHIPSREFENGPISYVGNGLFGIEIDEQSKLYIKYGRFLSLPVHFNPIIHVSKPSSTYKAATVVDYLNGIAHKFQCFKENFFVSYEYYAHRTLPNVFVQEIKVTNMKNQNTEVHLSASGISNWKDAETKNIKLQHGSTILEYQVVSGMIDLHNNKNEIIVVSIVSRNLNQILYLKKRGVTKFECLLTVEYSEPIAKEQYFVKKNLIESNAVEIMKKALQNAEHSDRDNKYYNFKRNHIQVWKDLWKTGFEISSSLAENSINGNKINATIYAVLCNVRTYEYEEFANENTKLEINKLVSNVGGCYDSYHTLQAENLWKDLTSIEIQNSLISSWLLTLEKQGCHNLIKAGASGVIQAMVLSLGGFRFSNQHLELNIHPKYLHRDYVYRHINYGNSTHLNVYITVKEDNKAVIYVELLEANRQYYACDAGCLDEPVLLSKKKKLFPVKLTEPLTAILYIASDKQHIEELHHAIHVKEVVEAPAHEHHVIALHKHGHHLGSLPTFFWISICLIIIIFHIFLCKLIIKEYCESPSKLKYRYNKP